MLFSGSSVDESMRQTCPSLRLSRLHPFHKVSMIRHQPKERPGRHRTRGITHARLPMRWKPVPMRTRNDRHKQITRMLPKGSTCVGILAATFQRVLHQHERLTSTPAAPQTVPLIVRRVGSLLQPHRHRTPLPISNRLLDPLRKTSPQAIGPRRLHKKNLLPQMVSWQAISHVQNAPSRFLGFFTFGRLFEELNRPKCVTCNDGS